ncbi:MAG: ParB/RepB/Spo0J family partition protein [Actinomycetota bacterium]
MAERRKLGRGLSTLIPTEKPKGQEPSTPAAPAAQPTGKKVEPAMDLPDSALRDVPVDAITPNPHQPRQHFDDSALADLAKSIAEIGVLQPLLVRETGSGRYELIAGERRWRAAQRAKLTTVPVVVREVNELASVEQALVENLHREDLTALEEAAAYQQLVDDFGLTHEQVSRRVGKSRAAVTNALRLLHLPAKIQGYLADGRLSAGHARALLSVSDAAVMESLAATAVKDGWSVRAVEEAVKKGSTGGGGDRPKPVVTALKPAGLLELEKMLADFLETRVNVSMVGKRGKISVDFADLVDLERIYRRMTEVQDN